MLLYFDDQHDAATRLASAAGFTAVCGVCISALEINCAIIASWFWY